MDYGIPNLVRLIKEGEDFYKALASQLYMKPPGEITKDEWYRVKEEFWANFLKTKKKLS